MCSPLISSIPYTLEKVQTDYPWAWGTVREKSLLHSCNNKTPRNFSLLDFPYEVWSLALVFLTLWSFSWFTSVLIDWELISIWRFYFSSCLKKSDRAPVREFAPLAQDHVFPRMCCLFRHTSSWKTQFSVVALEGTEELPSINLKKMLKLSHSNPVET